MNTNIESHDPDRIDILIGRVVDSEASAADWHELEQLADADPQLWGRLARAQRAHARLTDTVEDELTIAELVDLPDPEPIRLPFVERVQRWSGWALAAALCLAWLLSRQVPPMNQAGTMQAGIGGVQPVFVSNTSPDQAWSNYVETARLADSFVSELPPIVVSNTALAGGGQEIFYVRRSLERVTLTDVAHLRVSQDEQGRTVLISTPSDLFPMDSGQGQPTGSGQPL